MEKLCITEFIAKFPYLAHHRYFIDKIKHVSCEHKKAIVLPVMTEKQTDGVYLARVRYLSEEKENPKQEFEFEKLGFLSWKKAHGVKSKMFRNALGRVVSHIERTVPKDVVILSVQNIPSWIDVGVGEWEECYDVQHECVIAQEHPGIQDPLMERTRPIENADLRRTTFVGYDLMSGNIRYSRHSQRASERNALWHGTVRTWVQKYFRENPQIIMDTPEAAAMLEETHREFFEHFGFGILSHHDKPVPKKHRSIVSVVEKNIFEEITQEILEKKAQVTQ